MICIFVLCSCNFEVTSKFIMSLEDAIELEISGYESFSNNKIKTRVHFKNYFDSVKDINGYSYYFILDKAKDRVIMQIRLYSKMVSLLDYKFGFIFDFGFKLSFLNIHSGSFDFKVEEILKSKSYIRDNFDLEDINLESSYAFSLKQIREINHEFEVRNHISDINSSTSDIMYFVGGSKYSVLKESYIVLYYYVFKAIERFMQY
ncbi:hypothetical protein F0310_04855 (plasmid) [Borrelia sp. A-FGy1]|uniref:hypothetical protein n=1 Tax=Borrelia sp. A-FGy1 TaxID=2608247 RepID=UPI0015F6AC27|nr:hypothetical protein [Borrelia sp. A-FGy1]QMU99745.1 hypothetical protein F0310_04855 [Borrelia sp. A-FGy1]